MRKKETFSWLTRACMTLLLAFFAISIYAQNVTVKGSVKDQLGDPVIGATVKVLGSSTGTVTDIDGNFSISCSPNATLEFSYIGFSTKAVDVKGHTKLEVTMNESTSSLDEVVVTALGIKRMLRNLVTLFLPLVQKNL
jgi:hypothetical protein